MRTIEAKSEWTGIYWQVETSILSAQISVFLDQNWYPHACILLWTAARLLAEAVFLLLSLRLWRHQWHNKGNARRGNSWKVVPALTRVRDSVTNTDPTLVHDKIMCIPLFCLHTTIRQSYSCFAPSQSSHTVGNVGVACADLFALH